MLLEKTYQTFDASNVLLQQQYRLHGFKKYRELIGSLLIVEQNNELLLQNHDNRATGSAPIPEVNATSSYFEGRGRGNARQAQNKKGNYNRYGMEGHWYRAYRTAKHWVDLYQASLKIKANKLKQILLVIVILWKLRNQILFHGYNPFGHY
ncbi:hypothetical protein CFOL_v3_25866 [Cephalotus follicularis]|uniref:Uncharacterized protein n=1 Tax=Cephalotus follicularis TaxID=3775 RepID=A0A1Q3CQ83_CEPFO|nr:hypothetical protein CFOL_v3_25866 [Cephalotus follicularis]